MAGSSPQPVRRSAPADTALLLRAASRWSEALQSRGCLEDALGHVARSTGAVLSLLLRFTGGTRRPVRLCVSGAPGSISSASSPPPSPRAGSGGTAGWYPRCCATGSST